MKLSITKANAILIAVFAYVIYLFLIDADISNYKTGIYIMSVMGWIAWAYMCISWKKLTGELFSLYIIFISFAVVFTYGQCLMWALGIHGNRLEIIGRFIEGRIRLTDSDIFRTQLLTIVGLLAFHAGAMCQYKRLSNDSAWLKDHRSSQSLVTVCKVMLVISTICAYYYWLRNGIIYRSFGYGAYQYGENSGNINSIIIILGWMFIPSMIGVLVGNNYKKTDKKVCYTLFAIFVVLCTFAGDRAWIYNLVILVWLHYRMQGTFNTRRFVRLSISGLIILTFAEAVSTVRGGGLSFNAIINSIINDNPISSAFFEMGGTMAPTAIIFHDPNFNYPFGNSYLLSIPEMITTKFITFFVPEYQALGGWFSQTYLGLSYGAGFSMIAEALANYGRYVAPLWMILMGVVIARAINIQHDEKDEITIFFKSTTCISFLYIVRNSTVNGLKQWFFTTFIIMVLVTVLTSRKRKRER